jgi:hypothetical protein
MKRIHTTLLLGSAFLLSSVAYAGNKDRIGQAGAQEILINPWGKSNGMVGANSASSSGLESVFLNVSGLTFIDKTELQFTHSDYLAGSGVSVNAFGLAQRVGEASVLAGSVTSVGFGDIERTTIDNPDGGIGTFSPQLLSLNISYARAFSNTIHGGFNFKTISESINDAQAAGIAIDMGIRYVTGPRENLKFGIALKNVGPKMNFNGDGFTVKTDLDEKEFTLTQRRQAFELPSTLSIGASYDLYLLEGATSDSAKGGNMEHRLTFAGTFISNSFGKDMVALGVEYGFNNMFMVRGGFLYEDGIDNVETRTTAYTGPSAGATIRLPMGKGSDNTLSIDYAYRFSNPFNGTHSYGVRLNF